MKPTLIVDLGDDRSYPIYIGSGILLDRELWTDISQNRHVAVVSNETVMPLYGDSLAQTLSRTPNAITIQDGEEFKTLATYSKLIDELLEQKLDRSSILIALGGGVVGDITGFVAASYYRGIPYVQVPTTLLAQVDSAVGGKTAINHARGKNLIGAFYQPMAVVIDVDTLASLPQSIYVEGLAEVIKYGVIADANFFEWLEENVEAVLRREPEALAFIIQRSCEIKAEVVAEDEQEQGRRAILNYGHTFGHAIENLSGYGQLLHGEAVSIGMRLAAELSCKMNLVGHDVSERISKLLSMYGLPLHCGPIDVQQFREAMSKDKKVIDGQLRFILVREIGTVEVVDNVPEQLLNESLSESASV